MKPILELTRVEEKHHYGTFGYLRINKEVFCVTLEPPDLLNETGRSSIPAQQYTCKRILSPTFGETFEVLFVPGRTGILFHAGNVAADTKGCIILAQHWGKLRGDRAVLNSGKTFKEFMGRLKNHGLAHLTIKEDY